MKETKYFTWSCLLKKLIISSDCKVGPREILQAGKGGFLYKVGNDRKLSDLLKI